MLKNILMVLMTLLIFYGMMVMDMLETITMLMILPKNQHTIVVLFIVKKMINLFLNTTIEIMTRL